MSPQQVREYLHREPFQPFRARLEDGRTFDIVHPNLGLVGESVFLIGIPALDDPQPIYADRTEWVPLKQISDIELIPESAAPAGR